MSNSINATTVLAGTFTVPATTPTRTENTQPHAYRLGKKPDGTLVLQDAYIWQEDWNNCGHELRDILTMELEG